MRHRPGTSIIALLILTAGVALAAPPVVRTTGGLVEGTAEDGISAFRGIPYALPPVGALRWRPPRAAQPWQGVRDASRFGPICPQELRAAPADMRQDEDCLTLNVYAPAAPPAGGVPVMVWIHGGSFRWGAGSLAVYDGVNFARQGVVLVTLNYRLDRLGRFAHPALRRAQPDEDLGNYGLMDQLAALAWVRANSAAFGGDPDRITIFGFSAGGVSVNALMVSPAARGRFQRAISQSGGISLEAGQRLREPAGRFKSLEEDGLEFAARMGIPDHESAVTRLRALDAAAIIADPVKDSSMNPVVDGRVIPDDIGRLFQAGRQHPVPYLAGANSWEASLIRPFNLPLPAVLLGVSPDQARAVYGPLDDLRLKETYFGDALFMAPAWQLAARMAAVRTPAWLYYYSYVNAGEREQVPGAAHGAEVSHLFRQPLRPGTTLSAGDLAVSEPLRRYWIGFAHTGDPNGPGRPLWTAFTRENPAVMEFGQAPVLRPGLFRERMAFHAQLAGATAPAR